MPWMAICMRRPHIAMPELPIDGHFPVTSQQWALAVKMNLAHFLDFFAKSCLRLR